jgi:hypothetical protein
MPTPTLNILGQPVYRNSREQRAAWQAESRAAAAAAAAQSAAATPAATSTATATPGGVVVPENLQGWDQLNTLMQTRNREDLAARIPGAEGLELQSSGIISQLLNPPTMFADVSRRAAEVGAGRGIPGSEAVFGTGLRMTDEERLRRMALGQQMLTGAYARNPVADQPDPDDTYISPEERADIYARNRALAAQEESNETDRIQANLNRTVQGSLGRQTDAMGNPVQGLDPDQLLNTGMWVWG